MLQDGKAACLYTLCRSNYQLTSRLKTRCPEPCYRRFDVNMVGNSFSLSLPAAVVPVDLSLWSDLQRSCVLSVVAMAWLAVSVSAVQVELPRA